MVLKGLEMTIGRVKKGWRGGKAGPHTELDDHQQLENLQIMSLTVKLDSKTRLGD